MKATYISFRYVPLNENPADLPTRGLSGEEISEAKLWWYGPSWLKSSEHSWPEWYVPPDDLKEIEATTSKVIYKMSAVSHDLYCENKERCSVCDIDADKYSFLRKLLRITVYVYCLKFIKQRVWNTLSHLTKATIGDKYKLIGAVMSSLTYGYSVYAGDIKMAARLQVYTVQRYQFQDVFVAISKKIKHCLIQQLGLKVDELGILRCYGQFLNVKVNENTKYPKLLPRHMKFTYLLIMEVHVRLIHAEIAHTLAQIREEYWIPQGRVEVRSVLLCCLIYRRHEGPSFQLLHMPRESFSITSIQFVGLDYLGPVYVKANNGLDKIWICLFTYLSLRAIHIEWVMDLTAT